MKNLVKYWKSLIAKNPLFIVVLLLLILALFSLTTFVISWIYNSIRNQVNSASSTLTTEQALSLATALHECFNNAPFLSNVNCIKTIFQDKTISDYYKIKQAFGTVPRNNITGDVTYNIPFWASNLNLTEWLAVELSANEKQQLKNEIHWFNEIL